MHPQNTTQATPPNQPPRRPRHPPNHPLPHPERRRAEIKGKVAQRAQKFVAAVQDAMKTELEEQVGAGSGVLAVGA